MAARIAAARYTPIAHFHLREVRVSSRASRSPHITASGSKYLQTCTTCTWRVCAPVHVYGGPLVRTGSGLAHPRPVFARETLLIRWPSVYAVVWAPFALSLRNNALRGRMDSRRLAVMDEIAGLKVAVRLAIEFEFANA